MTTLAPHQSVRVGGNGYHGHILGMANGSGQPAAAVMLSDARGVTANALIGSNWTYRGQLTGVWVGGTLGVAGPIGRSNLTGVTMNAAGYVEASGPLLSTSSGTAPHTVMFWCKTTHNDVTNRVILSQYTAGDAGRWVANLISGGVRYQIAASIVCTSAAVNDGAWHHVAFTRDAARLVTPYVDGVAGTPGTDADRAFTNKFFAVSSDNSGIANYAGSVFGVQVYNYALSAAEVMADYLVAHNGN